MWEHNNSIVFLTCKWLWNATPDNKRSPVFSCTTIWNLLHMHKYTYGFVHVQILLLLQVKNMTYRNRNHCTWFMFLIRLYQLVVYIDKNFITIYNSTSISTCSARWIPLYHSRTQTSVLMPHEPQKQMALLPIGLEYTSGIQASITSIDYLCRQIAQLPNPSLFRPSYSCLPKLT